MNRELLLKMLGLAAGATDAQINEALAAHNAGLEQLRALATSAAGAVAATVTEAVATLSGKVARLGLLEAKEAEEQKATTAQLAEAAVGKLVSQKRLPPAMKSYAIGLYGTSGWDPFVKALGGDPGAGAGTEASAGASQGATGGDAGGAQAGAGKPPPVSAGRHRFDATDRKLLDEWGLTEEQAAAALERHARGELAARPRDTDEETV